MKLFITGANGFVGTALCTALSEAGMPFRRALRQTPPRAGPRDACDVVVGELGPDTDWTDALAGVSQVVHLAARTHVTRESRADTMPAYRQVNVLGTHKLAEAAVAAGVEHFVFLSSIKVNGERTMQHPFNVSDSPCPEDAYAVTKFDAEQELKRIATGTDMAVTIIRSPLVYGPGVKGNFLALMRAVDKGIPLPLASIENARSLICVENLVSAIINCLQDARAASQTFLVSDGEDLSTPQLIRQLAAVLAVRPRLFRFPPSLLRAAGGVVGRRAQVTRLTDSLQVDSSHIRQVLGWRPPFSVEQGLAETACWFVSNTAAR